VVTGVQYPPGSLPYEQHLAMGMIEPGALASLPVHPVQLYEAGLLLVLILVLTRVAVHAGRSLSSLCARMR
jgi:phosphatidylglycerol:prolipoprotein diacylglycerol transferase